MYMFFVALSASYWMVIILVNTCWPFVAYICVLNKKYPKNDQKSRCGHRRGGFCPCWCSDFDITSRWSSKGPFNSPETVLCYVEYLIFWVNMKFGEISILTIFSYHFMYKNSTYLNIVFDLQVLLRSIWIYSTKIELFWDIYFFRSWKYILK